MKRIIFQQIKGQISIADFLSKEGITPTRTTAGQLAYIAPYRDEQDPSLIVNDKIGVWYDHGLGEGGRIIDLAMKIYQTTDVQEVVQRINDLYEGHVTAKYPDRLDGATPKASPAKVNEEYIVTSFVSVSVISILLVFL